MLKDLHFGLDIVMILTKINPVQDYSILSIEFYITMLPGHEVSFKAFLETLCACPALKLSVFAMPGKISMKKSSVTRYCNIWALTFLMIVSSIAPPVLAGWQLSGELWMNGTATVNGKTVTTGLTILSGNRIQTGKDSTAMISLGKLGSIKLQPESDLILTFTETTINGNLSSGLALVNVSENVGLNLKTPCGEFDSTKQNISSTTLEVSATATPNEKVTINSATNATGSTPQESNPGRCVRIAQLPQHTKVPVLFAGGWGIPMLIVGGVFGTLLPVVLLQDSNVSGLVIGPPLVTPVRPN